MRAFLLVSIIGLSAAPTAAQQPKEELLPPPRVQPVPQNLLAPSIRIVPGPQVGRRDVWELLAVDSRGRFVPRVVLTPPVPYYLYNGQPYPFTTISSLPYMPYTTD